MPAQTDPDAPEILRQVEALQARTDGYAKMADFMYLSDVAKAALLPLLEAVTAKKGLTHHRITCKECDAYREDCDEADSLAGKLDRLCDDALRAVAEALGEAHA